MTITTKKLTATTAATFAAAMTSLYAAPEVQAQALDLIIDGGPSVAGADATFNFISTGSDSNSVGGDLFLLAATTTGFSGGSFGGNLAFVGSGQLSAANFPAGGSFLTFASTATGTAFVGFQLIAGPDSGNVGFFQVDFGPTAGGPIDIISGQFGSNGAAVTVPATAPVPEPAGGALAALALGAIGLRRKRKVA